MYYSCILLLFPDCRISVSVVLWLVNNQASRKATSLNPSLDKTHVELSCKESSFSIAGFKNHLRSGNIFLDYQKFMILITPHQELSCKESSFSIAGFKNHLRSGNIFLDYQKFMILITPHQLGRHVKPPAPPLKLCTAQHALALDPTCMFSQDTLDRDVLTNCMPSTLWKLCGDNIVPAILQRDL